MKRKFRIRGVLGPIALTLAIPAVGGHALAWYQRAVPEQAHTTKSPSAAVIRGTVSGGNTGTGVRGPRVMLLSLQGDEIASARGDDQGHFELQVPAEGRYEVAASAPGYLTTYWGETAANGVRRRLEINSDIRAHEVSIILTRGGAITGRVVDESGDPLEGIPVYALEVVFASGMDRLVPTSLSRTRTTDDEGRFRVYGLEPGEYFVVVSPGALSSDGLARTSASDGYPMTLVPGTRDVSTASKLSVAAGQDVETGTVTLTRTPFVNLSGRLVTEHGLPLAGSVRLLPGTSGSIALFAESTAAADGGFTFRGITPGTYLLQLSMAAALPHRFGTQVVVIAKDTSVILQARPGRALRGRLELEDGSLVPDASAAVEITATPEDYQLSPLGLGATSRINSDSTFDLEDVWGPHRLEVVGTSTLALKSVVVDDEDYTNRAIDFEKVRPGQLRIVLTQRTGSLEGSVRDHANHPVGDCDVIVFPSDREAWDVRSRQIRRIVTDRAGRFKFKGLLPQEYRAAAVTDLPVRSWRQREYLDTIRGASVAVAIVEGRTELVELRVGVRQ